MSLFRGKTICRVTEPRPPAEAFSAYLSESSTRGRAFSFYAHCRCELRELSYYFAVFAGAECQCSGGTEDHDHGCTEEACLQGAPGQTAESPAPEPPPKYLLRSLR